MLENIKKSHEKSADQVSASLELVHGLKFQGPKDLQTCHQSNTITEEVDTIVNTLQVDKFLAELKGIGKTCVAAYANAFMAGSESATEVQTIMISLSRFLVKSQSAFDFLVMQCLKMCQKHKYAIEGVVEGELKEAYEDMLSSRKHVENCLARVNEVQKEIDTISDQVKAALLSVVKDHHTDINQKAAAEKLVTEMEVKRKTQKDIQNTLGEQKKQMERTLNEYMIKLDRAQDLASKQAVLNLVGDILGKAEKLHDKKEKKMPKSDTEIKADSEAKQADSSARQAEAESNQNTVNAIMKHMAKIRENEEKLIQQQLAAIKEEADAVAKLRTNTAKVGDLTVALACLKLCNAQLLKVETAIQALQLFWQQLTEKFKQADGNINEIVDKMGQLEGDKPSDDAREQKRQNKRREARICKEIRDSVIVIIAIGSACYTSQLGIASFSKETQDLLINFPNTDAKLASFVSKLGSDLDASLKADQQNLAIQIDDARKATKAKQLAIE